MRSRAFRSGALFLWIAICVPVPPGHAADSPPWPAATWPAASPASMGLDAGLLAEASAYAEAFGGAGLIIRHGHVVSAWGDSDLRFELKSTTKSIGATAVGLAMADGLVTLDDRAGSHMPTFGVPPSGNSATGWLDDISLLQLATHTAGFEKTGGYGDLVREPGTAWLYSDGAFNWLADVLTNVYREDLNALLFRRVFTPLGITGQDLVWRSNAFREDTLDGIKRREFGSGIRANVDALARIGYLYLNDGVWDGEAILPAGFVDIVRRPANAVIGLPVVGGSNPPDTSNRYGVAWFTNADSTLPEVPADAYWAWGLRDSLIVVIPSLQIVAARAGDGLGRTGWNADYSFIAPFITPIARSAATGAPLALVPDVIGLEEGAATIQLVTAGLVTGAVTRSADPNVPAGRVVTQDPWAGTEVPSGSPVALVVSLGESPVEVPDVIGQVLGDAVSTLESAGLAVATVVEAPSATAPQGTIVAQAPEPGTLVAEGTDATLNVSSGPSETAAWLSFDGANDVASVPSSAELKLSSAFSIEARIQPRSLSTNKRQDRILRKGVDYELMLSTNSAGCTGGTRGDLQLSATLGGVVRKLCGGALTLDAWQHVAGTYDGSEFVLYVDGNPVGSLAVAGAIKRSGTMVTIGNVKALSRPFHGDLAEVALWRRALSPAEVMLHAYEALSGSETGLVAYWPMRDGSGQTLRDAATSGLHGRLGLTSGSENSDPLWGN